MPKRILLIGLLFIICGVLAVWSIIEAGMRGGININFGVFLLPVGIGLLQGKASSQWWARFWIFLGYVLMAVIICFVLVEPKAAQASWFGKSISGRRAAPYVLGFAALFTAGLWVCHKLLYSPKARAWFSAR